MSISVLYVLYQKSNDMDFPIEQINPLCLNDVPIILQLPERKLTRKSLNQAKFHTCINQFHTCVPESN